jgi:hypothetical protein
MSAVDIRRISVSLIVAAMLAFVQTVHAQRAAEPAASSRSGSTPRPADAPGIVPFKIQVPNAMHFPAFEQPKLWGDNIRSFFRAVR